jgi:soluble lytic murein transglycosylase-like protein
MNLDHLDAVKARVEEIRRKISEFQESPAISAPSTGTSFAEALSQAKAGKHIECPQELQPMIAKSAAKYDVDPALVKSVIKAESGFRSDAVSRVGAKGLMQLMPGTARSLGVDPTDPEQNIDGGTQYLKQLIDKFGSVKLAVAAYNAGSGAVARYGGVPPYAETQRYVEKVMNGISAYSENP